LTRSAKYRWTVLCAALLGCAGAGYLFRYPLLLAGINFLLADAEVTVAELQGLGIGDSSVRVGRAVLLLPGTAQRLLLNDIALGYRQDAGLMPIPVSLNLGALALESTAEPAASAAVSDGSSASVGMALELLRNFPLRSIEAATVALPFWPEPFALSLQGTPGAIALTLRGERYAVDAAFAQPDAASPAQVSLELRENGAARGDLSIELLPGPDAIMVRGSANLAAFTAGSASVTSVALAANGSINTTDAGMQLTLEPGFTLSLQSAGYPDLQLSDFMLSGSAPLVLRYGAAGEVQVESAALAGRVGALAMGEWSGASAFTLRELQLAYTDTLSGTMVVATEGLAVAGPYDWLPAFDLAATLTLADAELQFDTPLLLRTSGDSGLRVQGVLDLAAGGGTAQLVLPQLDLAGEGNSLSARLGGWPWEADVVGGTLAAELDLAWQAGASGAVTGTLNATFASVAGFYGSSFFRGLDLGFAAAVDTSATLPLTTAPMQLRVAELDVGLPLRNIVADLQADQASQSLMLASLYGELLDGVISATDQRYRIGSVDNVMTIQFAGFRLERLLELTEYKGVEASGAVSGEVPLVFSAEGIEVAGGRLFAVQPGGTIRYLGAAGSGQGNAALDIMNRALSNYRFESLESSIDYSPDGELVLSMQLQGRNPDMDNGRQVNLNLNVSDNIPALLQSLQAGRAIEDFLEELYR